MQGTMSETNTLPDADNDELAMLLCQEFNVPIETSLNARLVDDLGFDSLRMLELVAFIEDIEDDIGIEPGEPGDGFPIFELLNDVYLYYSELKVGIGSDAAAAGEEIA